MMNDIVLLTFYYAAGIDQVGVIGEQALSLADKYTLSWIINLLTISILLYISWQFLTDRLITRKSANERVAKEREIGDAKVQAEREKLDLYKDYRLDVERKNQEMVEVLKGVTQRVEATTIIASNLKPKKDGEENVSEIETPDSNAGEKSG